ncbi:N-succinyldiaminopimelate aminotransferase [Nocardioides luteus]|uniref:Aminotransferase n=1 Tax=Nocardioides luteus TaxID=1844 RepID=A0ABQ5SZ02_9ACTN|nr:aminotransferase class I/II-fold pyridoxal phosphate-dependent enzyme [Nocardioides luteus]MDR7312436.1 N-succinyldiaminopimelate aminotransferase [Nocardioides luteus]GGR58465.1 aminotransferase [Nocardioides luteus]GLJ68684.1 aminotransferase [Nocardioides luteus]
MSERQRTTVTARRLDGIPPTIFSQMSALAVATGAVNLGQGFPDVDGPERIIEEAVSALHDGRNQYAPGPGIPALREAVAAHQQRHYDLTFDPAREVAVTTGATEGIATAILALVDPGDEVILVEPYYDSYPAMVQFAGGVRRPVTLSLDASAEGGRLPREALEAAASEKSKMLLLNSPHNPTGTVLTREELETVATFARDHDLVVVSDEVYEHLTFDGTDHIPIATLPGMRERTLTLSSIGKSFSFTGWKVGWATGPEHLVQALLGAKQWMTFTSGAPLQPAAAYALDHLDRWPKELALDLQERRDLLCDGLKQIGLDVTIPEGTYFAVSDISDLGWRDGLEFCEALPDRAGVVAIPLQGFYDSDAGKHLVRWTFTKQRDVIEEALDRLARGTLKK